MFFVNKTTSTSKRCKQKCGIIPARVTSRPTPVISRRKSVGKVNYRHQNPPPSLREGTMRQSTRLRDAFNSQIPPTDLSS